MAPTTTTPPVTATDDTKAPGPLPAKSPKQIGQTMPATLDAKFCDPLTEPTVDPVGATPAGSDQTETAATARQPIAMLTRLTAMTAEGTTAFRAIENAGATELTIGAQEVGRRSLRRSAADPLQGPVLGSTMEPMTEQLRGEIRTLSEEECWELVDASSVGRFGFVQDGDVKIIPVNYLVDVDVIIRTLPNGILAKLAGKRVTFEVDYHGSHGTGWSVLMHGPAAVLSDDEAELVRRWNRVLPWAGGDRSLFLSFTADTIEGRRVNRHRN